MADPKNTENTAPTEKKKRAAPTGPRKNKPYHVAFRVVDVNGAAIDGAKLEVGVLSRDLAEVVDFTDSNEGFKRFKLEIPASKTA